MSRVTCYNVTADTLGWVSDPNYRSTMSIITSCIVTMGLCVWSALHLNIPSGRDGLIRIWLRNIKWMFVGVFGPELVVFAAWRQYVSARTMQKLDFAAQGPPQRTPSITSTPRRSVNLEEKSTPPIGEPEPPPRNSSRASEWHQWTIVHGFYAAMGGLSLILMKTQLRACVYQRASHII